MNALALTRASAIDSGVIAMKGGQLSSTSGALISVNGGAGTVSIDSPDALVPGLVGGRTVLASVTNSAAYAADVDLALINASNVIGDIDVTGADNILNASFTRSDWTGDFTGGGNTANLALNAARWTGRATGATAISVDAASDWNITGSSDAQRVVNTGRVMFEHTPGNFRRLTTRDYIGSDGILGLNTLLGNDTSRSDQLVIDGGTASGTTKIIVNNAGGRGAQTTGDGIHIVGAISGGTTDPAAFQLADRVAAGAYEYLLFRADCWRRGGDVYESRLHDSRDGSRGGGR